MPPQSFFHDLTPNFTIIIEEMGKMERVRIIPSCHFLAVLLCASFFVFEILFSHKSNEAKTTYRTGCED